MAAKKKGPSLKTVQQRKLQMQKIAKGGPQLSGTKGMSAKPAAPAAPKPATPSKPSGRQPRAITNGNSPAMRQIRAKAVQARRQAEGKPVATKGKAVTLPNSARAGQNLIKQGAQRLRTIGDSGQVRAAQARGQAEVAKAQARRGARAATQAMSRTLAAARTARNIAGAAKMAGPAGVAAAVLAPRPLADGSMAGRNYGKFQNARSEAFKKAKAIKGSPVVGPKKSAAGQFDSAFAAARKAGKSTFTWRGKKYTTQMK